MRSENFSLEYNLSNKRQNIKLNIEKLFLIGFVIQEVIRMILKENIFTTWGGVYLGYNYWIC